RTPPFGAPPDGMQNDAAFRIVPESQSRKIQYPPLKRERIERGKRIERKKQGGITAAFAVDRGEIGHPLIERKERNAAHAPAVFLLAEAGGYRVVPLLPHKAEHIN